MGLKDTLKGAASFAGAMMDASMKRSEAVNEIADHLTKHSYDLSSTDARKAAEVLYTHAEPIVWK